MDWPADFWWGTGASSTQCEGAAPASDWWDWERAGRAPHSGEGNGFGRLYAEDFDRFAAPGADPPPAVTASGRASNPRRVGTTPRQ